MITLYEPQQIGASHAPFTRAYLELVCHAFPDQKVRLITQRAHLDEALSSTSAELRQRLDIVVIPRDPRSIGGYLRMLLRNAASRETGNDFSVFLSTNPSSILAAKLYRRLQPSFRCHLALHSELAGIKNPRSRNPLHRAFDITSALTALNHRHVRFLALERHIRTAVNKYLPGMEEYFDVLRHPCAEREPAPFQSLKNGPIRFGLVGIAGKSKGLDVFAEVAKACVASGRDVEFRVIGKLQSGWQSLDLDGIAGPRPFVEDWLPIETFRAEIAALHYIVLPYDLAYYELAASGVLLDAIRYGKPIIHFPLPTIDEMSSSFGPIGYQCTDPRQMITQIIRLADERDQAEYIRLTETLATLYTSRRPAGMASAYRDLIADLIGRPAHLAQT